MLKRKLAAVILTAALLSAACSSGDQKKLAQASQDAAGAISTLLALDQALIDEQLVSKDDAIFITSTILDINRLGSQLKEIAKTYNGSAAVKAQVVGLLNSIAAAIKKLNDQGVLHIKNPDKRLAVSTAVTALQTALAVVAPIVGGAK